MALAEGLEAGMGLGMRQREALLREELMRRELALRQAAEERLQWEFRARAEDRRHENESKQYDRTYRQLNDETAYTKRLSELYPEPEAAGPLSSVQRAIDVKARGGAGMPRPGWMPREEQARPSPDFVGPMPEDTGPVSPDRVMAEGQEKALGVFKRAAAERQKGLVDLRRAGRAPEKPVIHDLQAMEREIGRMNAMAAELESGVAQSKFGFVYETMNPGDRKARAAQLRDEVRLRRAVYQVAFAQRHGIVPTGFNPKDYADARKAQGATPEEYLSELREIGVVR